MNTFYAAIDPENSKFCIMRALDGKLIARCDSESWSCAITDALNFVDRIAEQASEMKTWPE